MATDARRDILHAAPAPGLATTAQAHGMRSRLETRPRLVAWFLRWYGRCALIAIFRILRDVVVYRIRKREMANLASSLSIMVAMGLAWSDLALRFVFALGLNLAVYLTNDIYDVGADLASSTKDSDKAAFLRAHRRQAWLAVLVPVVVMLAIGLRWNRELLVTLTVATGVCWAYSARIKRIVFLDLPAIVVCAISGSMLAFPLDSMLGWALAGLLGLFAASFQTVQMVRDHDEDAAYGTRTTAVALGTRATIQVQRVLLAMAAGYAMFLLHRWVGLLMFLTMLLPFREDEANEHWNRIRAALGLAWLAIVVWVGWTGSTDGLLLQIDRGQVFPW